MSAKSAFMFLKQAFDNVLLTDKLSQIRKEFPGAQLAPSRKAAAEYVAKVAPDIVYTYMICTLGGLKQCSSVSPYFAAKASDEGFATLVAVIPNHQYNIMLTEEGPLAVDMTRLQFEVSSFTPRKESLTGEFVRHFNPKSQQSTHPEYGSEADLTEMYEKAPELLENTELAPGEI